MEPPQTIMKDKWMNIGCEEEELKPFIETEPDLSDPRRLEVLQGMGHTRDEIEESLKSKKYDDIMANYLLLGKKTNENDQSDSRSSSSLSLRGLRPPLESANVTANNGQSPGHIKVQRSVSATTKPRRFSHTGAEPNAAHQNVVTGVPNTVVTPTSTSSYKQRQNTLELVKERPENNSNGPSSPVVAKLAALKLQTTTPSDTSPISPAVLNTTKITGLGSLRQTPQKASPSPINLKNTFSGIPRRNTYNYSENKSLSSEKTELPSTR